MLGYLFGVKELAAIGAPEIVAGLSALAAVLIPEGKGKQSGEEGQP